MTKKTRRKFTDQEKAKAVAEYLSGAKSAKDIAQELGVEVHVIYHWRAALDEQKRESRLSGFTSQEASLRKLQNAFSGNRKKLRPTRRKWLNKRSS